MLIYVDKQELQLINMQLQSAVLKYLQTARTDLANSGPSSTSQIQGIRENLTVWRLSLKVVFNLVNNLRHTLRFSIKRTRPSSVPSMWFYATKLGGLVHTAHPY